MMQRLFNSALGTAAAALVLLASLASPATGQTAPAGNAHPETHYVSETPAQAQNPFGESRATNFDVAKKRAFAAAVDIEPLRDLAVSHNGRTKIIGTLATEAVSSIVGRKTYFDLEPTGDGRAKKLHYDPVFTFFDLMIDPAYYADKPLVHVEVLPLREAFLERAYNDPAARDWWKKIGRLPPTVVSAHFGAVASSTMDPAQQRGLDHMANAMQLYMNGWRNLLMVAPDATHQEWEHLSMLPPQSEAGRAVRALGEAWRAGDADGANSAIRTLAAVLPTINSVKYPTTRRAVEAAYNQSNPFEWGMWFYCLSFLALLLAFGTGRAWLRWAGMVTLLAAVAMHGAGFAARCYVAERFAIQNQFESMTGLSLFAAIVGLGIMVLRRQYLFGAAAAGVGFLVLVTATQTGIPGKSIEREAAILNTSVLLKYHVTTVLVSYGLISLGMIISLFYLATYYAARMRGGTGTSLGGAAAGTPGALEVSATALGLGEDAPKGTQRVLSDLDKSQMIVLQLAFWTLGVGILLGAWWADHSWGRWWAWDPKELWALVTWIVYLIVIHLRFTTAKNKALTTAWLSVVGFIVMLWCYFGVNLLLPGLHAYA